MRLLSLVLVCFLTLACQGAPHNDDTPYHVTLMPTGSTTIELELRWIALNKNGFVGGTLDGKKVYYSGAYLIR